MKYMLLFVLLLNQLIFSMDPVCSKLKKISTYGQQSAYISLANEFKKSGLSLCDCLGQISQKGFKKILNKYGVDERPLI